MRPINRSSPAYRLRGTRLIQRLDRLQHDRGAARNRFLVRPFLWRVTLAIPAWHENHGRGADAAQEGCIVSCTAGQIGLAKAKLLRRAPQRRAQDRIASNRRRIGQRD